MTYRKKKIFCRCRLSLCWLPYKFIPFSHLRGKFLTVDCLCIKPKLLQLSRFVFLFDTSVKSSTTDERTNVTIFLCTAVNQCNLFFYYNSSYADQKLFFFYRHIIFRTLKMVTLR